MCKKFVRLRNFLVQCCILTIHYSRCLLLDPAATINLISGTHREEAWASTTTFPFKFSTSVNVLIVTTGNKTSTHIQFYLFSCWIINITKAKRRRRVYSHSGGVPPRLSSLHFLKVVLIVQLGSQ